MRDMIFREFYEEMVFLKLFLMFEKAGNLMATENLL